MSKIAAPTTNVKPVETAKPVEVKAPKAKKEKPVVSLQDLLYVLNALETAQKEASPGAKLLLRPFISRTKHLLKPFAKVTYVQE